MKIAVFPNPSRDTDLTQTKRLVQLIGAQGGDVLMQHEFAHHINTRYAHFVETFEDADLLICLGGDGTFLSSIRIQNWRPIPTIGVNLGSVGFLPQIQPEAMDDALSKIMAGQFIVEPRMMLKVRAEDSQGRLIREDCALNDVVLGRGVSGRIVTVRFEIDGELVEHIPGDGVIVSTPTGSTAYTLSAGGPIVHPAMSLFLVTPLCPHSLHNRSYITSEQAVIRLTIDEHPEAAIVAIDGQINYALHHAERLVITVSEDTFKLIRLGDDHFYTTLSAKIQQRGSAR